MSQPKPSPVIHFRMPSLGNPAAVMRGKPAKPARQISRQVSPVGVHLLVIILIFAVDDRLPPGLVVQIPADGLFYSILEHGFREPAEFIVDLGRVNGIAQVVSFAVRHIGDQALRFSQLLADQSDGCCRPRRHGLSS